MNGVPNLDELLAAITKIENDQYGRPPGVFTADEFQQASGWGHTKARKVLGQLVAAGVIDRWTQSGPSPYDGRPCKQVYHRLVERPPEQPETD